MKPIKVHGKAYYPVAERVKLFKDKYPNSGIKTEIIEMKEDRVVIKATAEVSTEAGELIQYGVGHAEERSGWGRGKINLQSMIENCETSAVGRALAFLGIGVTDDIASADEMQKVKDPGDAGFAQVSMIESLLQTASIPDNEVKKIERELHTFSAETATKCIKYLKDNQASKKLDDQLSDKLNDERQ